MGIFDVLRHGLESRIPYFLHLVCKIFAAKLFERRKKIIIIVIFLSIRNKVKLTILVVIDVIFLFSPKYMGMCVINKIVVQHVK